MPFLGGILTTLIGVFFKSWPIRYKARLAAATDLKLLFNPIIDWLEKDGAFHTAGRLRDSRDEIDRIVENFGVHLKGREYRKFVRVCETFYKRAGEKNQKYLGYASLPKEEAAKEALKNIKAILRFTKPVICSFLFDS